VQAQGVGVVECPEIHDAALMHRPHSHFLLALLSLCLLLSGCAKSRGPATASAPTSAPSATQAVNDLSITQLRQAIDERYSYRDLRGVDWNQAFAAARPALESASTPEAFATAAGQLLAAAKDIHISLTVGTTVFPSYVADVVPNWNMHTLGRLLPSIVQANNNVLLASWPDGIGYVAIATFRKEHADDVKAALAAITAGAGPKGLVLDVRMNEGGDETLAQGIAGCFLDAPKVYAADRPRDPTNASGFAPPQYRQVGPNPQCHGTRAHVAVLMSHSNMSSAESFLLMMKQVPTARLFGEPSWGASGNPQPVTLANGVTVLLPSWQSLFPDGSLFEGVGVTPDVPVATTPAQLATDDPVLDAALAWLRGGS
jgi:hypothetical protein